jgi:chromatin remodeling complex protein RSC6
MYVRRIFKGILRINEKMDISFDKLLSGVQKIKMDLLELTHEIKTVEKEVKKGMKAYDKLQKPKAKTGNRKPSGFAEPVRVSKELQTFMKLNEDDKVARTEVTKYLSSYIKEHKLKSPENGRVIVPNPELSALLGAKEEDTITYFNLQRFMNKHFVSSSNALE